MTTLAVEAGAEAMSATRDARPLSASAVESAIRQLAATGRPFSANDARALHGVRGGVVGATFNALRAEGVIRPVGSETSTDRGTHGKPVARWVGAPQTPAAGADLGKAKPAVGPHFPGGGVAAAPRLPVSTSPGGCDRSTRSHVADPVTPSPATGAVRFPAGRQGTARRYGPHDPAGAPTTSTVRCGGASSFCSQPGCRAEHEVPRPVVVVEQRRRINELAARAT